jgi:hypothetical protein
MWMVVLSMFVVSLAVASPAPGAQDVLKDPDGKALAVVWDCSSCEKGGDKCDNGVENGFHDGARCGQCLMKANYGNPVPIPYDVRVFGSLKDEKGDPLKATFVRLFLPNGWSIRTRTTDKGMFVLRMGPTGKRQSGKPLALDLGDRKMRKDDQARTYTLFMLPNESKPCGPETESAPKK